MDDGLLPQFGGLNRLIGFFIVMEANLFKEAAARAEAQGRFVYLPFPDDVVGEAFPGVRKPIELLAGDEDVGFFAKPGGASEGDDFVQYRKQEKASGIYDFEKNKKSLTSR